jgi:hypothetical protein
VAQVPGQHWPPGDLGHTGNGTERYTRLRTIDSLLSTFPARHGQAAMEGIMHTAGYADDLNDTARIDTRMRVTEDGRPGRKLRDVPRQGQGGRGGPRR